MPAIITPHFRRRNAQRVYEAAQNLTDTYYIGLGKNDPWTNDDNASTYTVPTGSDAEVREALMNLIALKRVNLADEFDGDNEGDDKNISYVIPNVKWKSGNVYKAWNPFDINCFYAETGKNPCYAIRDNHLFLCIESPLTTGSYNVPAVPTGGSIGSIGDKGGDNYRWVKLQDASTVEDHPFVTKNYYPIVPPQTITTTPSAGKIIRTIVDEPGASILQTGTIAVPVLGDGTLGSLTLTIQNQTISSVDIANRGSDYTYGSVELSTVITGSNSSTFVKPVISIVCAPKNGFGSDNVNLLPTWFLGFTSSFADNENGEFLIDAGTDYRQISLIKNPEFNSDTQGDNSTCLLKIKYTVPNGSEPIQSGKIITVYQSSATNATLLGKAFVDYSENVSGDTYVYVHQNYSSNVNLGDLTSLVNTNVIKVDGITYPVVQVFEPEYVRGSGDVIFLENRGPIKRDDNQTETIKVIVQF